ncbi:MAG: potassium transporter Kup [Deltaproteobacteria bacterium]|nr:potassium transporter Kup [Deltaproteobacteria bacterium]MCW5803743.1 potassium transporter Kup [Deltaproteobacteria bacterium]
MHWTRPRPPGSSRRHQDFCGTSGAVNDAAHAEPRAAHGQSPSHGHGHTPRNKKELAALSLGALGVAYGDIGTSPLYAMAECLSSAKDEQGNWVKANAIHPLADGRYDPNAVLGILSLFFWSLTLVVCVKYLVYVLRADNKGEGGTISLAALVDQKTAARPGARRARLAIPILLALFGTGLLYGEGLITPAISVLSAVEGIAVRSPALSHLIIPIAVAILVGFFLVQRFGTGKIGAVFGWVMLVWFTTLAVIGAMSIARHPSVLEAVSPHHAVWFFAHHGWHGFLLLGSVVLCITGCESLYADMGHFGRKPIRIAWTTLVFPALLLNYFGQGALFLSDGAAVKNPFYDLVDGPLMIPMIVLATMAAVIASQALISGAFSLTNQAVQLGYLPRVTVVHTSHKHEGQIYIPEINYFFMVACVALVLSFKTSTNLAAAYGVAVTGLMGITSYLIFLVCRRNWGWSLGAALALYLPLVLIDVAFFSSNLTKVAAGGWFPLAVGVCAFAIMTTWWRGRQELSKMMETGTIPDDLFLADIAETPLPRVSGTAVFMASGTDGMPNVLLHHVKHNKVLHKQVVLLSVVTEKIPFAIGNTAISVRELEHGFYRVIARVGFMQQPNVPRILARCERYDLVVNASDTTYYLGRQTLLTSGKSRVARWRKMLFSFLARNSRPPTAFFHLPPNRVVELGLQIEL